MGWLYGDADAADQDQKEDKDDDEDVVDVSGLSSDDVVESGVTSGADPSDWDPIDIDGKP